MLTQLKKNKNIRGYGVEKDDANWLKAINNGVDVIQMDLESGLSGFEAQSFDVVILSQTLQAVLNTEAIVTFPNFGYWRHRKQLMVGQMPVSKNLPYQWYDTPNVHLCTIKDFDEFCRKGNIVIEERLVLTDKKEVHVMPNLMGSLAMYRLRAK